MDSRWAQGQTDPAAPTSESTSPPPSSPQTPSVCPHPALNWGPTPPFLTPTIPPSSGSASGTEPSQNNSTLLVSLEQKRRQRGDSSCFHRSQSASATTTSSHSKTKCSGSHTSCPVFYETLRGQRGAWWARPYPLGPSLPLPETASRVICAWTQEAQICGSTEWDNATLQGFGVGSRRRVGQAGQEGVRGSMTGWVFRQV